MKNLKIILVPTLASLFAVLTVFNMSLASPKSAGENTLDMLEIMTRAFDESEGGEGGQLDWCDLYCPGPDGLGCIINFSNGASVSCIPGTKKSNPPA
jgi:hypothetical protein